MFNTVTGLNVPLGFGGEVHLGTVKVPDARIDKLSALFKPKKTTYAEIVFSDIPGEHGAERREALEGTAADRGTGRPLPGVARLPNPAVETAPDPVAELRAFATECVIADLEAVERRLDRAKKDKPDALELGAFHLMKETLERELPLRALSSRSCTATSCAATRSSRTCRSSSP